MTDWDQLERITALPKRRQSSKRRSYPEQAIQTAIAEYLSWSIFLPTLWTAFPAGGGGAQRGKSLRQMGLKAGFPDLMIIHNGRYHGLEVKAPKGRLLDAQIEMHARITDAGGRVAIVRSVDDVRNALFDWHIPTREAKPISPIMRGMKAALGLQTEG